MKRKDENGASRLFYRLASHTDTLFPVKMIFLVNFVAFCPLSFIGVIFVLGIYSETFEKICFC